MISHAIASTASLVLQMTGGAVLAMVAAQAAAPTINVDPTLAASWAAIGALFGLLTWLVKGRIDRCDTREDSMLTTQSEQATAMRELAGVVSKAADVAASAVNAATGAVDESKRNGTKLDTILATCNDVRRGLERYGDESDSRRR